jgi:flagellar protein FlaG
MNAINFSGLYGIGSIRPGTSKQNVREDAAQPVEDSASVAAEQVKNTNNSNNSVEIADKLAEMPQITKRNLQFSIDGNTGESVFRVIDSETGDLIRQIPSEQILHIIEQVKEAQGSTVLGMLLDDTT